MRKKPPELKVVFDTSVLVTEAVSELMRKEVTELITHHSKHPDLTVSWYLPEVVLHERMYQMQQRAFDLLPQIEKTEKLLGHNLNITQSVLNQRLQVVLADAVTNHNLHVIKLDASSVNWNGLIEAAVFRRPPFESGKKEKGFRDAVIIECLAQLVDAGPQTPSVCLVALISGDALLSDAARTRTAGAANVRILESNEELATLINTLVSQVDEDVIKQIRKKANEFFFVKDDKSTVYYRENIAKLVRERFGAKLDEIPPNISSQELEITYVTWPDFQRKQARRFHWITHLRYKHKLFRAVAPVPSSPTTSGESVPQSIAALETLLRSMSVTTPAGKVTPDSLPAFGGTPSKKELAGELVRVVDIHWSVSVDVRGRLSSFRLDDVRYVGPESPVAS